VSQGSAAVPGSVLRLLAPGTALREAVDRIRRGRTGALVVLGHDERVQELCDGGVELDVAFAPARLRELSKMDGAVVLSTACTRILRANVHLVPDHRLPTTETGTRHRAAERTALQTGHPVLAVSSSMNTITVYDGSGASHVLGDTVVLMARSDQTVAAMERHGARTALARADLDAAELGDYASVREVVTLAQRFLRAERLGADLAELAVELGEHGRHTALQLEELLSDTPVQLRALVADHLAPGTGTPTEAEVDSVVERLRDLSDSELLLPGAIARLLGLPAEPEDLDAHVTARGHRALSRIPRLRPVQIAALVDRFGSVPALLAAEQSDLADVEGVGALWARHVRQWLTRLEAGGELR